MDIVFQDTIKAVLAEAGMVSVDAMDGEGFMERTATFSNGEDAFDITTKWCKEYSRVVIKSMDTGQQLFSYVWGGSADAEG